MSKQYSFDSIVSREQTDSVKWRMAESVFEEKDILPMWVADMDFPIAREITAAIKRRAEHEIYGYAVPDPKTIDAVINRMKRKYGWQIKPEWLVFIPGIVPALYASVKAFTQPGDEVILQSPVYRPFWSAIKENGCQVINNRLIRSKDRYEIDFKDLADRFTFSSSPGLVSMPSRVRMMLFCSPHNPVGRVWTNEELIRIGETVFKNNAIIVSDEIHAEILFKGSVHTPLASLSPDFEQCTITCISPSKAFNIAGLNASVVIIPNSHLRSRFAIAKNGIVPMMNSFGLVAMEAAYTSGDQWLSECLEYLQGNLDFLMEFINRRIPRIHVIKPEGTYLVWLDFSDVGLSDMDLRHRIRKIAKLGLEDGFTFGPGGEGFQRINIACPRSILQQALERLERAVNSI